MTLMYVLAVKETDGICIYAMDIYIVSYQQTGRENTICHHKLDLHITDAYTV